MAIAVEFREFTPKNSRNDLIRRLEVAPEKHAEAILAAYELLQRLHEKGLIDIANGLLFGINLWHKLLLWQFLLYVFGLGFLTLLDLLHRCFHFADLLKAMCDCEGPVGLAFVANTVWP